VFAAAEGQHVRYDDDGEVAAAATAGNDAIVTVDGWLQLRLPLHHVAHICCLRHRLTQAFAAKASARQIDDVVEMQGVVLDGQSNSEVCVLSDGSLYNATLGA